MKPQLWVVEMRVSDVWLPTVGVGLGREHGRDIQAAWKLINPNDTFRLRPYMPMRKEAK